MTSSLLDEEWSVIAELLPKGWEALAKEKGALVRQRGIKDAETLLRILLLHASGPSLRQTATRARQQGLASISDVALYKRLRASGPWLESLTRAMFRESRFARRPPKISLGRTVRAIDATTVEEPGSSGTDWRVHYSLRLPDLVCDHFELTDPSGGETYTRFPIETGDIVLADRGYSHRAGVAHVLESGGDVVVRLNTGAFPLQTRSGSKFQLLEHLRRLKGRRARAWTAEFVHGGKRYPVRICAVRKTAAAVALAKKKLLKERPASKRATIPPATLEFAEYVIVLTTLPATEYGPSQVLELYRARWQVELAFKRLKSLLKLGALPKRTDASSRAWLQAKMLTVLLIERLLEDARSFSPWGFQLAPA